MHNNKLIFFLDTTPSYNQSNVPNGKPQYWPPDPWIEQQEENAIHWDDANWFGDLGWWQHQKHEIKEHFFQNTIQQTGYTIGIGVLGFVLNKIFGSAPKEYTAAGVSKWMWSQVIDRASPKIKEKMTEWQVPEFAQDAFLDVIQDPDPEVAKQRFKEKMEEGGKKLTSWQERNINKMIDEAAQNPGKFAADLGLDPAEMEAYHKEAMEKMKQVEEGISIIDDPTQRQKAKEIAGKIKEKMQNDYSSFSAEWNRLDETTLLEGQTRPFYKSVIDKLYKARAYTDQAAEYFTKSHYEGGFKPLGSYLEPFLGEVKPEEEIHWEFPNKEQLIEKGMYSKGRVPKLSEDLVLEGKYFPSLVKKKKGGFTPTYNETADILRRQIAEQKVLNWNLKRKDISISTKADKIAESYKNVRELNEKLTPKVQEPSISSYNESTIANDSLLPDKEYWEKQKAKQKGGEPKPSLTDLHEMQMKDLEKQKKPPSVVIDEPEPATDISVIEGDLWTLHEGPAPDYERVSEQPKPKEIVFPEEGVGGKGKHLDPELEKAVNKTIKDLKKGEYKELVEFFQEAKKNYGKRPKWNYKGQSMNMFKALIKRLTGKEIPSITMMVLERLGVAEGFAVIMDYTVATAVDAGMWTAVFAAMGDAATLADAASIFTGTAAFNVLTDATRLAIIYYFGEGAVLLFDSTMMVFGMFTIVAYGTYKAMDYMGWLTSVETAKNFSGTKWHDILYEDLHSSNPTLFDNILLKNDRFPAAKEVNQPLYHDRFGPNKLQQYYDRGDWVNQEFWGPLIDIEAYRPSVVVVEGHGNQLSYQYIEKFKPDRYDHLPDEAVDEGYHHDDWVENATGKPPVLFNPNAKDSKQTVTTSSSSSSSSSDFQYQSSSNQQGGYTLDSNWK